MKKIICALASIAILAVFTGCESTKVSKSASPYTISSGDKVVGYYTFDEEEITNDTVLDHSGNDSGADTNSLDEAELVDGHNGNALFFNGEDQYITIPDDVLSGDGFTVAMWVQPAGWRDWQRIFDIGDGSTCDAWAGMDFETKQLRFDVFGANGSVKTLAELPEVNEWTHVAATLGNGSASLYVNGKLAAKGPCAVTPEDLLDTVNGIYIGRSNWSADPLFFGAMDEVLVAARAFSAKEIASVYNGVISPK